MQGIHCCCVQGNFIQLDFFKTRTVLLVYTFSLHQLSICITFSNLSLELSLSISCEVAVTPRYIALSTNYISWPARWGLLFCRLRSGKLSEWISEVFILFYMYPRSCPISNSFDIVCMFSVYIFTSSGEKHTLHRLLSLYSACTCSNISCYSILAICPCTH